MLGRQLFFDLLRAFFDIRRRAFPCLRRCTQSAGQWGEGSRHAACDIQARQRQLLWIDIADPQDRFGKCLGDRQHNTVGRQNGPHPETDEQQHDTAERFKPSGQVVVNEQAQQAAGPLGHRRAEQGVGIAQDRKQGGDGDGHHRQADRAEHELIGLSARCGAVQVDRHADDQCPDAKAQHGVQLVRQRRTDDANPVVHRVRCDAHRVAGRIVRVEADQGCYEHQPEPRKDSPTHPAIGRQGLRC